MLYEFVLDMDYNVSANLQQRVAAEDSFTKEEE